MQPSLRFKRHKKNFLRRISLLSIALLRYEKHNQSNLGHASLFAFINPPNQAHKATRFILLEAI